jgi:hypothetical protein
VAIFTLSRITLAFAAGYFAPARFLVAHALGQGFVLGHERFEL